MISVNRRCKRVLIKIHAAWLYLARMNSRTETPRYAVWGEGIKRQFSSSDGEICGKCKSE